ncbi:hypothetical protein DYB31_001279, partial [Aphanomyces astaci]
TPDNKNCGGVKDATYPNNNYGFGRINIARAVGANVSPTPTTPMTTKAPTPTTPMTTKAPTPTTPMTTKAPTPTTPMTTKAPTPTAPMTTKTPMTTTPVTTKATPAPTNGVPTTTQATPVTTSAAGSCNGCKSCYSTSIGYCFPPAFSKAQCATFVDFKTIWCGV